MPSGGPTRHWGSDCQPMGLRTEGPSTTNAVTSAPQGTLQACQPGPSQQAAQLQSQPAAPHKQPVQPSSQPATPYEQAVQPPRRSTGRGLLARPTSDGPAPSPADSIYLDRGRQQTRGQGLQGRSTSRPRWGQGIAVNVPLTGDQRDSQFQPGRRSQPRPAEMAAKY